MSAVTTPSPEELLGAETYRRIRTAHHARVTIVDTSISWLTCLEVARSCQPSSMLSICCHVVCVSGWVGKGELTPWNVVLFSKAAPSSAVGAAVARAVRSVTMRNEAFMVVIIGRILAFEEFNALMPQPLNLSVYVCCKYHKLGG